MTRLLTCGYETGDINEAGTSSIGSQATLAVASSTPTPRGGTYCLKMASTGTGVTFTIASKAFVLAATKTDLWVRWAVYISPGTATNVPIIAGMYDSAAAIQTSINCDLGTGVLSALRGSATTVATGSALTFNTWHVLEWRVQITSTTVGIIELWLNGTRIINFSGDNTQTANANVQQVNLGTVLNGFNASGAYIAMDDIAINDTAGSANNGQPGDGRVVLLVPNGAGSTTGMSRGGTDTGANYSQCSELPPSTAQYVFSATTTTRDTYALTNLPVTPTSISVVEVIALTSKSDAGAGSFGLTVKSGSTTDEGTAQALPFGAWTYVRQLYETDPNGTIAWTGSAVNALEAGATVR